MAEDAGRNMYGCTPCPDCGSVYRWPAQTTDPKYPGLLMCDDCGRRRQWVSVDGGWNYDEVPIVGEERTQSEEP